MKTPIPRGDKWHLALARISGSSCAAADTFYHFDYRWGMSSFLFHINWEYTVLTKNVDCGNFPTCWGGINYPVQSTEGIQQKRLLFYLFLFPWSVLTPAMHQESFTKYIKIKYKKNIHTFVQCALEHITDLSEILNMELGIGWIKGWDLKCLYGASENKQGENRLVTEILSTLKNKPSFCLSVFLFTPGNLTWEHRHSLTFWNLIPNKIPVRNVAPWK